MKVFYHEMSEPREAMWNSFKKLNILLFIRIVHKFLLGTIEGIITKINL